MELIYYASDNGNVGDELNLWLWERVFGKEFIESNKQVAFLGIGSILLQNSIFIEKASKFNNKVIFGTGVRSVSESFNFDESWNISFLRGPFSSLRLTGNIDNYITDSAYYIALTSDFERIKNTPKKHKVSLIPYFRSKDKVDWNKVCRENGWNLIETETKNVDYFLEEIAASEFVISEAMHGAIVADIFRVPWRRLKFHSHLYEGEKVSEFKWNDWLFSIGLYSDNAINVGLRKKKKLNFINKYFFKIQNYKKMQNAFNSNEAKIGNLSSDTRFNEILNQLRTKKEELIQNL